MSTTPENPLEQNVARAIEALTGAARLTYTTPAGEERYDFGEIACRVIASVAANVGGAETLLAGRPGSWEADYVRQIIQSTVPEDGLYEFRTKPVYIDLDVDVALDDLGVDAMYWADVQTINDELDADGLSADNTARLEAELEAIDALREADAQAYVTAYRDVASAAARELGLTVPVLVARTDEADGDIEDAVVEWVRVLAHQRTPLPSSGIAPQDYPPGQLITDVERAAGRTYRARASARRIDPS